MGLIRKIREKADPWASRLEEPRKVRRDFEVGRDTGDEDSEVRRKRKMFGKVFDSGKPETSFPR